MIKVLNKSKIKTIPITFKLPDNTSKNLFIESFNYLPFVAITKLYENERVYISTVDPRDIIYVKLHNSAFIPEIELYCSDTKGILLNDLYPFDHDTIISIFIKSDSEITLPIRMDFRVTEYETINSDKIYGSLKYLIKGVLDVDGLHYTKYISIKDTSYNTLKRISSDLNLGFASNIQESNDEMTWINPGNSYLQFMENISRNAYISEDSFIWTFIDFHYNLNYINIQNELNEYNSEITPFNMKLIDKAENKDDKNVELYLTNNKAFDATNRYISKFSLINQSFKVNLEKCYTMNATWYDKKDNTVFKDKIENLTSETKDDDELRDLSDKSSSIYKENLNDEYFIGKLDVDNTHKKYNIARFINNFNIENIEKMKMVVILTQMNFSIKRFQNIRIEIYNLQDVFSKDANTKEPQDNINRILSGYWLVTGINYVFRKTGGIEQEVTLMRRDLSIDYGKSGKDKNDIRKNSNDEGSEPVWRVPLKLPSLAPETGFNPKDLKLKGFFK
jgi:hypothetical protein